MNESVAGDMRAERDATDILDTTTDTKSAQKSLARRRQARKASVKFTPSGPFPN